MTDLRQAAQQALEALEGINRLSISEHAICLPAEIDDAMDALRAALAEPEQEPVASLMTHVQSGDMEVVWNDDGFDRELWHETPLYTAPPQRKPLTDEEIDRVTDQQWAANNHKPIYAAHRAYARAIERAHGIGGSE